MRESLGNRTHEPWDRLLHLMDLMQAVFQEFLSLLREEEHVLQKMDRQAIAEITDKKEQVLEEMCRYEQQVMAHLHGLAGLGNRQQLGKWLKGSPQPQAVSVNALFHEIFELATKIQKQGKKNEGIIHRTQHVVREAINVIYAGMGAGPVYGGSGTLHFSSVPGSVNLHG